MIKNQYTVGVKTESAFGTMEASGLFLSRPFDFARANIKKKMQDLKTQVRTGIASAGMISTGLKEPTTMSLKFKGHGHNQAAITDTPAALPAALGYIDALLRAAFLRQTASYGYASHDLVAASGGTYTTLTKAGAGATAANFKAGAAVTVVDNDTADVYHRAFIRSSENSSGDLLITLDRNLSLTADDCDIHGAYIWYLDADDAANLDTKGLACSLCAEHYDGNASPIKDRFVGGILTKFEAVSKFRELLEWNAEASFVGGAEDQTAATGQVAWTQPTFIASHNCNLAVNNGGVVTNLNDISEMTLTIEPKAAQIPALDANEGVSGYVLGSDDYTVTLKAKFAATAALRTAYSALDGSATRVTVSGWICPTVMGTTNSPAGNVFGFYLAACQVSAPEVTDDELKNLTVMFTLCNPDSGNALVLSLA